MNTETKLEQELTEAFMDSFMKPYVTDQMRWFEVETDHGTEWIDQDLIGKTFEPSKSELLEFCEGNKIESFRVFDGYGSRLSASGFMDCTPWCVFETKEEAYQSLLDLYAME